MLPAANFAEKDGSFVNSARWIQWKWKAVDPPGEAKPDQEIIAPHLPGRARALREGRRHLPAPVRALNWWYSNPASPSLDEVARELNGWAIDDVRDASGAVDAARRAAARAGHRHPRRRHDAQRQLALHRDVHRCRQPDAAPLVRRPERPGPARRLGVQLAGESPDSLQPLLGRRRRGGRGTRPARRSRGTDSAGPATSPTTPSTARPRRRTSGPSSCSPRAPRACSCPASSSRGRGPSTTSRPSRRWPIPCTRRRAPIRPCTASPPPFDVLGTAANYPIVCTTYRLTEHFHYWTKNNPYTVQLQPEFFVEIPEGSRRRSGLPTATACASPRPAARSKARRWSRGASSRCRWPARRRGRSDSRSTGASSAAASSADRWPIWSPPPSSIPIRTRPNTRASWSRLDKVET